VTLVETSLSHYQLNADFFFLEVFERSSNSQAACNAIQKAAQIEEDKQN